MKAKRKAKVRGRPRLKESEKKERRVQLAIKLSEAERSTIDAAAVRAGKPSSTWVRELALSAAGQEQA